MGDRRAEAGVPGLAHPGSGAGPPRRHRGLGPARAAPRGDGGRGPAGHPDGGAHPPLPRGELDDGGAGPPALRGERRSRSTRCGSSRRAQAIRLGGSKRGDRVDATRGTGDARPGDPAARAAATVARARRAGDARGPGEGQAGRPRSGSDGRRGRRHRGEAPAPLPQGKRCVGLPTGAGEARCARARDRAHRWTSTCRWTPCAAASTSPSGRRSRCPPSTSRRWCAPRSGPSSSPGDATRTAPR